MKLALLPLLLFAAPAAAQFSAALDGELFGSTAWGPSEQFGASLAVDGSTLAVAAPALDHFSGTNQIGYVHVFQRTGPTSWVQVQLVNTDDFAAFDGLNANLALDGDRLVLGLPGHGSGGAVYVFERVAGQFIQQAKLSQPGSQFGLAVDVSGDTIAVGDPRDFFTGGVAYVYERDLVGPEPWVLAQSLMLGVAGAPRDFGEQLALDGDTLAVAAPDADRKVRVYERNLGGADNWGEALELTAVSPNSNTQFGGGLALDGDLLAVQATQAGAGFEDQIDLFQRDPQDPLAWTNVAELQGSTIGSFEPFAQSIALEGDFLVAGSYGFFNQGLGLVHVFARQAAGPDGWGEIARLNPAGNVVGDDFGKGLAILGNRVFVGAPFHDEDGPDAGSVYGYTIGHTPEAYCTSGTSAAGCAASIGTSGTPSASAASGFDLTATSVEGGRNGLFFFGANGRQANPWGNGTSYQCVVPPVSRTASLAGTGTPGACDGAFAYDLNARWTAKPAQNPGAGALVQAQLWYRDPLSTSNQTTSLSDAIEFLVGP